MKHHKCVPAFTVYLTSSLYLIQVMINRSHHGMVQSLDLKSSSWSEDETTEGLKKGIS